MSEKRQCAMRGSCGTKGFFGKPLPCPDNGPPAEPEDRSLLVEVCGSEYAQDKSCCTSDQLEALKTNFQTVESLIASCPACRNNFRSFFCAFTCSPDQGSFVNVTSTQESSSHQTAVASVDFHVGEQFARGFFSSCKDVQVSSANTYAMEFIGGGAKNYPSFFKFLGDEKAIGSPFQIDFPSSTSGNLIALDPAPRNCTDNDLGSRCTCIDCPVSCPALPPVAPPNAEPLCQVGMVSCLTFTLVLTYSIMIVGFLVGFLITTTIRRRRDQQYERMALSAETASLSSPRPHNRGLVGAASLAYNPDDDSIGMLSESRRLGHGASLLDPIETVQPPQHKLDNALRRGFYRLGLFAASSPWLTFASVFIIFGLLNIGWKRFEIETDPVRLWVSPSSESKQQKDFFDENFGPFYRTEQVFVTAPDSSVLSWNHLQYWSRIEKDIRALRSANGYSLHDVCFKPAGPKGACVVQSVLAWFGNDLDDVDPDEWAEQLQQCAQVPVDCLPDFQQPLSPHYVLGSVPVDENGVEHYLDAGAMVINYVVQDSLDPAVQARALEWEQTLREYLVQLSERSFSESGLEIAFSTGVSLEEEINKSTNMDVKIVVLSYLAMFLYVSLTLGSGSSVGDEDSLPSSLLQWVRNFPRLFSHSEPTVSSFSIDSRNEPHWFPRLPRTIFTGSKVVLGFFGICLVILAVASSVGLFSLLGVKVTLIIAEVIPFLVLAVGVDNVFILVHELDRQNLLHGPNAAAHGSQGGLMSPTQSHRSPFTSSHDDDVDAVSMPLYLSAEERVARTLAKMGPSILLSTVTETVAFALGALVPMPAVRNFALYAAGSVLLNAILQVTVFISALYLDLRRMEASRIDCFPCIRLPPRIALVSGTHHHQGQSLGRIAKFVRRTYAPFLLKPLTKGIVGLLFTGVFFASVISMQHIKLGLDQRLALPSDSYLVSYFDNLDAHLNVGPPVYFVSRDLDVTERLGQQALCGRFTTCQDQSMANLLEAERKRMESSFISEPSASWIDEFFSWLDPEKDQCCRVRKADPTVFCSERDRNALCRPCYLGKEPAWNITMAGLPESEEFMRYLRQWLISPTNEDCPVAGKASFGTALSLDSDRVVASHFRTSHSPLKSQEDYINSFAAAHRVADEISAATGTSVFPYSLHYVFFDQYAHIIAVTQEVLGLGLGAILLVNALLLGSWRTASIVTAVVALTVVNVMGVMAIWEISLNAISLVNLVISLGIAVEFCAHVARAFMSAGSGLPVDQPGGQRERDERMWNALVDVGPSVLSGITFTKLIGMSVLALTHSRLLEIYYFRMWLTLIISGALHGLVLLPVILSVAGGSGFPQHQLDEEWMANAIRNDSDYYAPFLADDDSVASD